MIIKQSIITNQLTESGGLLLYSRAEQAYQVVEYHNHQSLRSSACQSAYHKTRSLLSQQNTHTHTHTHSHTLNNIYLDKNRVMDPQGLMPPKPHFKNKTGNFSIHCIKKEYIR